MSPITHFLASWTVADAFESERRDRALVTLSGVLLDLDGAGMLVELVTRDTQHPLYWFEDYHRIWGHNLLFCCILLGITAAFSRLRWKAALLALCTFHLHIVCDVVGGRGPDGSCWPIPYFWPFNDSFRLSWSGAWALNAWPNFVITGILILTTFYTSWRKGYSPLEIISKRLDAAFVRALRLRFGSPKLDCASAGDT